MTFLLYLLYIIYCGYTLEPKNEKIMHTPVKPPVLLFDIPHFFPITYHANSVYGVLILINKSLIIIKPRHEKTDVLHM